MNNELIWMGTVPQDWQIKRLQEILYEINEKNNPVQTEYILSLTNDKGVIPYDEKGNQGNKSKEDFNDYKIAYENTIVANSMNILIGSVGISNYFGCVSPVYYVFKNNKKGNLRYINYILQTKEFQKELRKYANGILEIRMRVSSGDILKRKIAIPPLEEQGKIADFLDIKVSEIDNVIEKTKATIDDYKKYKQAIINDVAISGLYGTKKKKSSIDNIDSIPYDWDELKCSFLFRENVRTPYENSESLSLSQIDGLIKTEEMVENSLKTSSYEGWKRVEINDLVLNRFKGHLGVVFAANLTGMVSFHYGVYEPQCELISKYYEYLFHTDVYKGILANKSNGMTVALQNLSNQNFYSLKLLFPSIQEQKDIVRFLDKKCSEIDKLILEKQKIVGELEKYKKSLIYEYVTGKKEVK